ncbi:MAG: hypothetical protein RBU29_11920 [bacterium]|jgi:hypothetical protein|nr:hypothetical protein [bacterium]
MISYILNFTWLSGMSTAQGKMVFLILFVLIGVLVSLLPRGYIYEGVEHPRWYHNLKLWAYGNLAFIFIVYYIF